MVKKNKHPLGTSWLNRMDNLWRKRPKNRKELIRILRHTATHTALSKETIGMIENLLTFSDRYVDDVMIPRPQMVVIDSSASLTTILPVVCKSRHSRFPVVSHNRDKVIGILLAKDLLPFSLKPIDENMSVTSLIRPAIFIPKSKRLNTLLKEFRLNHYHMAIVVDEYGGVDGLVTIEDVLEEIVGDIADEYDIEKDTFIKALGNQEFIVNALTPIEDFNRYFKTNFDTAEYDTIGGLITQHLNRLPLRNEVLEFESFKITVLKADNRRPYLFKFKRICP
jgi:magnesium and cobalt transporter